MALGTGRRQTTNFRLLEIGAWDMDTDLLFSVPHNLGTNWTKVKSIKLLITNDAGTSQVDYVVGGATRFSITSTDVLLGHPIASVFDDPAYSSGLINRGDILLELEP